MTTTDYILALCGSALGGAIGKSILDSVINRNKNKLESQLKEQVFYKTLIADMNTQHEEEKSKIEDLELKVEKLTKEIRDLIKSNKEKDKLIDEYKENAKMWENNCVRLENVWNEKDRLISRLYNNED